MRIVSCNPLEVPGAGIPPAFSGLPAPTTRASGPAFRAEYDRTHRDLWADFNAWVVAQGAPPLPDLRVHARRREVANLYVFPEEADYIDARPLGPTWHRMDSSVRETDEPTTSCPPRCSTGRTAAPWSTCRSARSAAPTSS